MTNNVIIYHVNNIQLFQLFFSSGRSYPLKMALYKGAASEAGRAMQLKKKREKALEELEHRKRKIEEELKLSNIENKFATHYDAVEQQLKSSTIGLVTLTEMKVFLVINTFFFFNDYNLLINLYN